MARGKIRSFVGAPGGGGTVEFEDGSSEQVDARPQPNEFVAVQGTQFGKVPLAPGADFIKQPDVPQEDGTFKPGELSPMGSGTARTEFLGEIQDRKAEAERRMAAQLGARMGAKQKLDQEGRSMGYTQSQQRSLTQIQDSRAKSEQDVANGRLTPEQMQLFEKEYQKRESLIMPQMIRQQPSAEQELASRTFTNKLTGQQMYVNSKGDPALVPGQPDHAQMLKYWEIASQSRFETNAKGDEVEIFPTMEEQKSRIADMLSGTMAVGGAIGGQGGQPGQPQPQGAQATDLDRSRQAVVRNNKIDAMVQKSGKSREQVIADIEKAAGGQPIVKSEPTLKGRSKLERPKFEERSLSSLSVNTVARLKAKHEKQEDKFEAKAQLAGLEYTRRKWDEYKDSDEFKEGNPLGPSAAHTKAIREYEKSLLQGKKAFGSTITRKLDVKSKTDEAYNNYAKHIKSLGRKPVPRFKFVKTITEAGGRWQDFLGDEKKK